MRVAAWSGEGYRTAHHSTRHCGLSMPHFSVPVKMFHFLTIGTGFFFACCFFGCQIFSMNMALAPKWFPQNFCVMCHRFATCQTPYDGLIVQTQPLFEQLFCKLCHVRSNCSDGWQLHLCPTHASASSAPSVCPHCKRHQRGVTWASQFQWAKSWCLEWKEIHYCHVAKMSS